MEGVGRFVVAAIAVAVAIIVCANVSRETLV